MLTIIRILTKEDTMSITQNVHGVCKVGVSYKICGPDSYGAAFRTCEISIFDNNGDIIETVTCFWPERNVEKIPLEIIT